MVGSGLAFYQELFSNLQEGLSKERVQNSPSECSAVVLAFMECLRFCLLHEVGGEGPHETVQEYLIKEQVDELWYALGHLFISLSVMFTKHLFFPVIMHPWGLLYYSN